MHTVAEVLILRVEACYSLAGGTPVVGMGWAHTNRWVELAAWVG